jgi:hypothetical protein
MKNTQSTPVSQFIPEFSDQFLKLFPHRYDFLYAPHPKPGDRPDWRTESRHPLSDRLINQATYLYGVRFGGTTRYAMLDIDRGSPYHPVQDRMAIGKIIAALEPIGLVAALPVSSSRSGGIHLYLPFEVALPSWQIAAVVTHLLEAVGLTVEPAILEVLPNPRNYDPESTTLYKGHRLPLQDGCYLLGDDFNPTFTTAESFVHRWEWCTSKNDIHTAALSTILKAARRKHSKLSHKASKFLNDLNADIDPGWTDHGQTNHILGRIALREYIFGHLLHGSDPISGDRLVGAIVATAQQLPGYQDYCRHQKELTRRAEEWARCVENSKYWHYKQPKPPVVEDSQEEESSAKQLNLITWNSWQMEQARDRLRYAIAQLLDKGELPATARARFEVLTKTYNFSGQTLYHHRDLWHPDHLLDSPPHPPAVLTSEPSTLPSGGATAQEAPSLFALTDRNALSSLEYRQFLASISDGSGCNTPSNQAFSDLNHEKEALDDRRRSTIPADPPEPGGGAPK